MNKEKYNFILTIINPINTLKALLFFTRKFYVKKTREPFFTPKYYPPNVFEQFKIISDQESFCDQNSKYDNIKRDSNDQINIKRIWLVNNWYDIKLCLYIIFITQKQNYILSS